MNTKFVKTTIVKLVIAATLSVVTSNCKNDVQTNKKDNIAAFNNQNNTINKRTLKVIELKGSGYELGFQHGKNLKKEIEEIVKLWKQNTTKELGRDANEILREFMNYSNFETAIKEWTPDLYEEVRGIAEGSKQKFEDILVLNLLDEFWVYIDAVENHHCSDVGIPAKNNLPAMVAQNMDIEDYTDNNQVLMKIENQDDNPKQLVLTHPGLIALNGMNSSGFGVVVNTIMQLKASNSGVPVAFIVRRLISMTNKDEIIQFIKNVPHASGQNYIIGINGEVYDFEASAGEVVRFIPENVNGAVYHTNHPVVNSNIKNWYENNSPDLESDSSPFSTNSNIRFNSLEKGMNSNSEITINSIMNILRSKDDPNNPVCRTMNQSGGFTFASTIMILGDKPYLLITAGPPDESEYKKFEF